MERILATGAGEGSVIVGKFRPLQPGAAGTPEFFSPVLLGVSISDAIDNQRPHVIKRDLVTLVDTGADLCRVDTALAASLPSLTYLGTMDQASGNGTAKQKLYKFQILIEDVCLPVFCLTSSLRSAGSLFDLSVGMEVIRHFDLIVSRSRDQVSLEWIG